METLNTTTRTGKPPSRRRVFFYLLFPILLPVLVTAGIRLVTEAQAQADSRESERLTRESTSRIRRIFPVGAHRPPSTSHVADSATQALIEKAIRGQLKALTEGNYAAALNYSAAEFRSRVTPSAFQDVVVHGYSAMTSCKTVTFTPARIQAGGFGTPRQAHLEAYVISGDGSKTQYDYMLFGDADGWFVMSVNAVIMPAHVPTDPEAAKTQARGQIHHT